MNVPVYGGVAGAMARREAIVEPTGPGDGWRRASIVGSRGRAWFGGHAASPFVGAMRAAVDDPVHLTEAFVPLVALALFDVPRANRLETLELVRPWLSRLTVRAFAALRAKERPAADLCALARPMLDRVRDARRTRDLAAAALPLIAPWWFDEVLVILGHPEDGAWADRPVHTRADASALVQWLEGLPDDVVRAGRSMA